MRAIVCLASCSWCCVCLRLFLLTTKSSSKKLSQIAQGTGASSRCARLRRRVRAAALGSVPGYGEFALVRPAPQALGAEILSLGCVGSPKSLFSMALTADWGVAVCVFVEKQKRTSSGTGFSVLSCVSSVRGAGGGEAEPEARCGESRAVKEEWKSSARVTHDTHEYTTGTQTHTHTRRSPQLPRGQGDASPTESGGPQSGGGGPRSQPMRCKGWC